MTPWTDCLADEAAQTTASSTRSYYTLIIMVCITTITTLGQNTNKIVGDVRPEQHASTSSS